MRPCRYARSEMGSLGLLWSVYEGEVGDFTGRPIASFQRREDALAFQAEPELAEAAEQALKALRPVAELIVSHDSIYAPAVRRLSDALQAREAHP